MPEVRPPIHRGQGGGEVHQYLAGPTPLEEWLERRPSGEQYGEMNWSQVTLWQVAAEFGGARLGETVDLTEMDHDARLRHLARLRILLGRVVEAKPLFMLSRPATDECRGWGTTLRILSGVWVCLRHEELGPHAGAVCVRPGPHRVRGEALCGGVELLRAERGLTAAGLGELVEPLQRLAARWQGYRVPVLG
jgi:hypothetical protein